MDAFIYNADIYCDECGRELRRECRSVPREDWDDSDNYPQGPFADGGGESDCPQHCGHCHVFLENPLTDDGRDYVRGAIARGGEVAAQWGEFYGISLETDSEELL